MYMYMYIYIYIYISVYCGNIQTSKSTVSFLVTSLVSKNTLSLKYNSYLQKKTFNRIAPYIAV